mgnify:CR=1 FL=1
MKKKDEKIINSVEILKSHGRRMLKIEFQTSIFFLSKLISKFDNRSSMFYKMKWKIRLIFSLERKLEKSPTVE